MVREKAQEFIQQIMEEEVTELLGREKSEGQVPICVVKAEEAPRLRLGCLGDLLFLEE